MIKINENYSYKTCTVEKTVFLCKNNGEEIGGFSYKSPKHIDVIIKSVEAIANNTLKYDKLSNQLKNS